MVIFTIMKLLNVKSAPGVDGQGGNSEARNQSAISSLGSLSQGWMGRDKLRGSKLDCKLLTGESLPEVGWAEGNSEA